MPSRDKAAPIPGVARLHRFAELPSTQDYARSLLEKGAAADRTLVWSDRQSRGRGQMLRRWKSSPGGLYISLILKSRSLPPSRLAALSLWTAQAAARAIGRETGLAAVVKPPNDVLVYGHQENGAPPKKACGILVEARGGSRRLDWVVVGVGLNIANPIPKSLAARAANLESLAHRRLSVEGMLRRFMMEFWPFYRKFV
jgi:BirA family biotin operon repressor/biotin-[acetyl-CoA-carboxylase] ligase